MNTWRRPRKNAMECQVRCQIECQVKCQHVIMSAYARVNLQTIWCSLIETKGCKKEQPLNQQTPVPSSLERQPSRCNPRIPFRLTPPIPTSTSTYMHLLYYLLSTSIYIYLHVPKNSKFFYIKTLIFLTALHSLHSPQECPAATTTLGLGSASVTWSRVPCGTARMARSKHCTECSRCSRCSMRMCSMSWFTQKIWGSGCKLY